MNSTTSPAMRKAAATLTSGRRMLAAQPGSSVDDLTLCFAPPFAASGCAESPDRPRGTSDKFHHAEAAHKAVAGGRRVRI